MGRDGSWNERGVGNRGELDGNRRRSKTEESGRGRGVTNQD